MKARVTFRHKKLDAEVTLEVVTVDKVAEPRPRKRYIHAAVNQAKRKLQKQGEDLGMWYPSRLEYPSIGIAIGLRP